MATEHIPQSREEARVDEAYADGFDDGFEQGYEKAKEESDEDIRYAEGLEDGASRVTGFVQDLLDDVERDIFLDTVSPVVQGKTQVDVLKYMRDRLYDLVAKSEAL